MFRPEWSSASMVKLPWAQNRKCLTLGSVHPEWEPRDEPATFFQATVSVLLFSLRLRRAWDRYPRSPQQKRRQLTKLNVPRVLARDRTAGREDEIRPSRKIGRTPTDRSRATTAHCATSTTKKGTDLVPPIGPGQAEAGADVPRLFPRPEKMGARPKLRRKELVEYTYQQSSRCV